MGEEQEKDDNVDILTQLTNYVDNHLRVFRNVTWVLAGAGIILILRRTYVFRHFKVVSDVPKEFIAKNITFRGHVRELRMDSTLGVCHIPLLRRLKMSSATSDTEASKQSSLLAVSLLGVEFREGGNQWLADHLMSTEVKITPLQVTRKNTLDSIVYKKKNWFSSVCINEELLRQGVAVTCHVSTLVNSQLYQKLQRRLLKAEFSAEKKGVGIWKRPSKLETLQNKLSSPISWMKTGFNAIRNLGRLFSRKATKHEEK